MEGIRVIDIPGCLLWDGETAEKLRLEVAAMLEEPDVEVHINMADVISITGFAANTLFGQLWSDSPSDFENRIVIEGCSREVETMIRFAIDFRKRNGN